MFNFVHVSEQFVDNFISSRTAAIPRNSYRLLNYGEFKKSACPGSYFLSCYFLCTNVAAKFVGFVFGRTVLNILNVILTNLIWYNYREKRILAHWLIASSLVTCQFNAKTYWHERHILSNDVLRRWSRKRRMNIFLRPATKGSLHAAVPRLTSTVPLVHWRPNWL